MASPGRARRLKSQSHHQRRPWPAYSGAMGTAVVLLVVVGGLLLIPAHPLAGLLVLALGYGISRLVGGRSEAMMHSGGSTGVHT